MSGSAKRLFALVSALLLSLPALSAGGIFHADIPERELCVTETAGSPFELSVPVDGTLGALAAGSLLSAAIVRGTADFPAYDSSVVYDKSDVSAFERWAMNPYDHTLDTLGDIVLGVEVAVLPAAAFGLEAAFGNLPLRQLSTVAVMYAEAYVLSLGVKNLLKMAVLRPRPYMYSESRDEAALESGDWHYSWPSGHSTSAFMGATFISYVFCSYYPDSAWKVPVVAASCAVAAATGALRLLSGNHFLTDVIGGALLGAACGFAVPFVHHLAARASSASSRSSVLQSVTVTPNGFSVTLSF